MSNAYEAGFAKTPLGSDLAAGVESLDLVQEVTFTQYKRLILPIDGFAFWVNASIINPGATYNGLRFDRAAFNQPPKVTVAARTFNALGSLHYATDVRQEEAETYAAQRVIFTAEEEINDLAVIAPGTLWIGTFVTAPQPSASPPISPPLRFAFSSRSSFFKQADLYHYVGFAVYPDMASQIIDYPASIDRSQIVSNSLPAWLSLNNYAPVYGFKNPGIPLYPSFLVPDNVTPPFASVHVVPESTEALGALPVIDPATSSHTQLCAERVRITLWGSRNRSGGDFVDFVNQYLADAGVLGLMNMPVLRDEKRTQAELSTIAQKKSIEYQVSYHQSVARQIAGQLISQVIPTFAPGGVLPPPTPPSGVNTAVFVPTVLSGI